MAMECSSVERLPFLSSFAVCCLVAFHNQIPFYPIVLLAALLTITIGTAHRKRDPERENNLR
jgi:hypothetical protein